MRLFSPVKIGALQLANRIVKSAMAEGRCDARGFPSPELIETYENWAKGGTGLLITGMAHVRQDHGFTGREIGLYSDQQIEPLRQLTQAVHRYPSKIFAQICFAPPQISRTGVRRIRGYYGPSTRLSRTTFCIDRELTVEAIGPIVRDLAKGAARAQAAGFDGVQFHAAHGYLLSQFLSPHYNRRKDEWGGTTENRARILLEVIRETRKQVGPEFPITVKMNYWDGTADGLQLDESVRIAQLLEAAGLDAIEVSAGIGEVGIGFFPNRGGIPWDLAKPFLEREVPFPLRPLVRFLRPLILSEARKLRFTPHFQEKGARRFADVVNIPVMTVGGIRSRDRAEELLRTSRIQLVSLARPLVREPDLPARWQTGSAPADARCTSCNRCFVQIGLGSPLRCDARPDPTS